MQPPSEPRADMSGEITGLHHITAICSDAKENVRFYTQVLNLRFVKRTVNQDDPSAYHLYYGDETGSPGTLITFFTWNLAPKANGAPSASSIILAVEDLGAWEEHLESKGVSFERVERFSDEAIIFFDPEGLELVLIEHEMPGREAIGTPAMLGVCGVELSVSEMERSAPLLESFGYERSGSDGDRTRFVHASSSTLVDVRATSQRASQGAGSIHHVAFGVEPESQERLRAMLANFRPTPIIERFYFKSVYFHESSGVLFEIASNGPGFFIDEDVLGSKLVLPPWLEPYRDTIEKELPDL